MVLVQSLPQGPRSTLVVRNGMEIINVLNVRSSFILEVAEFVFLFLIIAELGTQLLDSA